MSNKKVGIVIGRFEGFHNGHANLLKFAASESDALVVLVCSANSSRNPLNPFSVEERATVIGDYIQSIGINSDRILFDKSMPEGKVYDLYAINDYKYTDHKWIEEVTLVVNNFIKGYRGHRGGINVDITLYGHQKDYTSEYLSWFPSWNYVASGKFECELDGTGIREELFTNGLTDLIKQNVPKSTFDFLTRFIESENYKMLASWHAHDKSYKAKTQFVGVPYLPVFVTADPVVVCKNHILLVKRKNVNGKGLYALPGGFVEPDETIEQAIFRELKEETSIDLPPKIIKNSLREICVFDDPRRSSRGRTITHAGLITINENKLPNVKGGDDASDAMWVNLVYIDDYAHMLFEDHYHIIKYMQNKLSSYKA